ncbi:MAG: 3-isopropylmalate dehydratase [Ignavibacteriae bacterium HGW-Ignavibacteriae-1]|jgi:3-isopropylmalate/(R)-2-methylmalate dehydratase small subunit|nr:MAG: 3-isopropylmalate dehydratase [Ignavibacteriae bacterium HGW-Ignavibacteriae-1]
MLKVIYKLEDDISTDIIYPGRYMATVLPTETPQYAFDDMKDLNQLLNGKSTDEQSILVAGNNFGCGSSREQAASTLVGHNVIIIAKDFARIFLQNAINLGLRTIICPDIEAAAGDVLEIHADKVVNQTRGTTHPIIPLPKARRAIVEAGGLIPYSRLKLKQKLGIS